jgi:predicted acyltransferase
MKQTDTNSTPAQANALPQRLYSLDALRGFDMFWIMGAEEIFRNMAKATNAPFWNAIANQLEHPAWNGFHMYDCIFPLFLFIAGAATPYSVGRELEKGKTKKQLLLRVIKRGLILVLLGLVYNNGLEIKPLAEIRFGSVLGRIGLAYMFANIIYLYTKQRGQIIWFGMLLTGYWLLLKFTSAPGFPMGNLTMEGNFASFIDRSIMPGRLYLTIHDPEGLTSTIPAIGTGLLGIMAGTFLKSGKATGQGKAARLLLAGVISIGLSLVWNLDFPINKNLWTSSFVLLVGGISLVFLSVFYYIIDVKGYKSWAFFFKVIGMNSILIYMTERFINWDYTNDALFHWAGQLVGNPFNAVAMAICFVLTKWALLYFMYKKKVFLRL